MKSEEVLEIQLKEFTSGFDNDDDPKVMVISIPLDKLVKDELNGTALLRGKMDEFKQHALHNLRTIRMNRAGKKQDAGLIKPGVIGPGGKPIYPPR